jgi:hypothetical protein
MNGQSDWPKSHLCPKWPILIGQMRFREVATQDVELLYSATYKTVRQLITQLLLHYKFLLIIDSLSSKKG